MTAHLLDIIDVSWFSLKHQTWIAIEQLYSGWWQWITHKGIKHEVLAFVVTILCIFGIKKVSEIIGKWWGRVK
jgi:hypothetical protein